MSETIHIDDVENILKEFDEKFLYSVVLGSTLNDGSELRWNVGDGKMPSIDNIKSFLQEKLAQVRQEQKERDAEIAREQEKKLIEQLEVIIYAHKLNMQGKKDVFGIDHWIKGLDHTKYEIERLNGVEDVVRWLKKGLIPASNTSQAILSSNP